MKRKIMLLMAGVMIFGFMGCKENTATIEEPDTATAAVEIEEPSEIIIEPDNGVDIDLTSLSSTFVYAEVFNMIKQPEEYEGKTVKMEGTCNIYQDPNTGKTYYACIVQDATQCCSQGLEFVLSDEYSQKDYPIEGQDITVKGIFSTYIEDGCQYLTMLDSILEE